MDHDISQPHCELEQEISEEWWGRSLDLKGNWRRGCLGTCEYTSLKNFIIKENRYESS